jgi:hypothetical protein
VRLGVQFLPHLFLVFRFLLHTHHCTSPPAAAKFLACATAAQNVSNTQGSWRWPLSRFSRSYIRRGFCRASCATLWNLQLRKSRSIAGPIEINSPNCLPARRIVVPAKISLTSNVYRSIVH